MTLLLYLLLSGLLIITHCQQFVEVVQDKNKVWWMQHKGVKFLTMGVNHVNNGGFDDGVGGRESTLCQQMTNNSLCGDTLSFCGVLGYSPYFNNTQVIYQNESIHFNNNATLAWANTTITRLKSWNMNTISGWSSTVMEQTASLNELYYAHLLDIGTTWITHSDGFDFDIFSQEYVTHCDKLCESQVKPRSDDPYLLGWQLDNELLWNDMGFKKFLDAPYNSTCAGYQAAIQYLQTEYDQNLTALDVSWNISATTWDDISNYLDSPDLNKAHFDTDNSGFTEVVVSTYLNVSVNAIKKYDQNHLILGVRNLGSTPLNIFKVMVPYVDTIDIHCYGNYDPNNKSYPLDDNPCDDIPDVHEATGLPIYVGEFSFTSSESEDPNTKGARSGHPYPTQQDRADAFNHFVNVLMNYSYTIGYHWWQFADEPPQGRWPDGEDSNYGLVNLTDQPWPALTDMIMNTNPTLYPLHNSTHSQ